MKTVSEEYKTSMAQLLRNRSHIHVTLENIDRAIASDGDWESNGAELYSDMASMDYNNARNQAPATLELNYWTLDGSFTILDPNDTANEGWVSDIMSDEDGECSTNPMITREFSEPHTLEVYTLSFDYRGSEWPIEALVTLYMNDVPVDAIHLSDLANARYLVNRPAVTCDRITVEILNQLPYRRARMESAVFGVLVTFDNSTVVSANQANDVDPLSRRLPQEELTVTVLDFEHLYDPENPDGIYRFILEKSPISIAFGYEVTDGVVEWLKPDHYMLNSRPTIDNERITFRAGGLLSMLTDTYYKSKVGTKTLYDMAEAVLQDANLGPALNGGQPWEIDEALQEMETTAVLPIDTHANCLQMIAHAARSTLYTDDDNVIHIKPFTLEGITDGYEQGMILDYATIEERTQVLSKTEQLKQITVMQSCYVDGDPGTTLYEGITEDTELHITFDSPARNITIYVSSGSVLESHIYGRAVDLVLSSGTKTVIIRGRPLSEGNLLYTLGVNATGAEDSETNPLITNEVMRNGLAEHVRRYLSLRNTYDVAYRGNPELETKDVVGMQTRYSGIIPVLVLTNAISYNGALRGQIKGKGLV